MGALSRSERPHPATASLDELDAAAIDELLARCDQEVFDALEDPAFVETLVDAVLDAQDPTASRIVLAGAGTSGRLAWLLARRHRTALARSGVALRPWIAGGPKALLLPVEGAEDDSTAAHDELDAMLAAGVGSSDSAGQGAIFVGISCGLSAPCVAAGLIAARERGSRRVVFGTNSRELARVDPLPGLERGFASALDDETMTLTPDVGPEPLTGSSRMKGGTATWLVLDAYLSAIAAAQSDRAVLRESILAGFASARELARAAAKRTSRRAAVEAAAAALRAGGRVIYLGEGDSGLAAVLDASECRPTFGVSRERVRAFVRGGWDLLLQGGSVEDTLRDALTQDCPIDLDAFERLELAEQDLVIEVVTPSRESSQSALPSQAAGRRLRLEANELLDAKLALNSISTTGFVRAGKVYGNRMLDLMLSNSKLFDRACRIVSDLAAVELEAARRSIVAALWLEDAPDAGRLALPVTEHLARARAGVVPLALLHARGISLQDAQDALAREPIVREALRAAGS